MPRNLRLKDAIVDKKKFGSDLEAQRSFFSKKLKKMALDADVDDKDENVKGSGSSDMRNTIFDVFSISENAVGVSRSGSGGSGLAAAR